MPVTERDGSTGRGIFTLLSVAPQYATDQLNNIAAFSVIRRWLKDAYPARARPSASSLATANDGGAHLIFCCFARVVA